MTHMSIHDRHSQIATSLPLYLLVEYG